MNTKTITTMALLLIMAMLPMLTGCTDIAYPPRNAVIVESSDPADEPLINDFYTREDTSSERYRLKKFDIVQKDFIWESPYSETLNALNDTLTIAFTPNSPQHYSVTIATAGESSAAISLTANGEVVGAYYISGDYDSYSLSPLYLPLNAGGNDKESELVFTLLRGETTIVGVTIKDALPVSRERFKKPVKLCTPNSSEAAADLYDNLGSVFGSRVLTAQQCAFGSDSEIQLIYSITAREPLVRVSEANGFIDTPDFTNRELSIAQSRHERGGITAYTWRPSLGVVPLRFSFKNAVKDADRAGAAILDLDYIAELVESKELMSECLTLLTDIDKIADVFAMFARSEVPVLFEPFPAAGSRLDRWGNSASDFIELWKLTYERLTDYHGLDNLIWVWSGGDERYYPGNEYVDIIGEYAYANAVNSAGSEAVRLGLTELYTSSGAQSVTHGKPAVISGSISVPSPDVLARDNAGWLMWALDVDVFALGSDGEVLARVKNMLDRFYNHELTVCLA